MGVRSLAADVAKIRGYTDGAPTAPVTVIMKVMYRE